MTEEPKFKPNQEVYIVFTNKREDENGCWYRIEKTIVTDVICTEKTSADGITKEYDYRLDHKQLLFDCYPTERLAATLEEAEQIKQRLIEEDKQEDIKRFKNEEIAKHFSYEEYQRLLKKGKKTTVISGGIKILPQALEDFEEDDLIVIIAKLVEILNATLR